MKTMNQPTNKLVEQGAQLWAWKWKQLLISIL